MNLHKLRNSVKTVWHACFKPRYLWLTNTVTSGALLSVGDGIQQQIEQIKGVHVLPHHDWARCGRLFVVGLTQGPLHHLFYLKLDKVFPKKNAKTVGKKILLDQIIAAPIFAITFFVIAGLLEGKTFSSTIEEFKLKFPAVYLFDWMLWPPSQAINFLYVPVVYRVLYINCVTIVWDAFLSYMKHYDQLLPPSAVGAAQMHDSEGSTSHPKLTDAPPERRRDQHSEEKEL